LLVSAKSGLPAITLAEDGNAPAKHHLPKGTHCLANRPGALDRWTIVLVLLLVLVIENKIEDEDENDAEAKEEVKMVGVGRLARPRLFDHESNRSGIPN
jgi:hypothetical protein